MTRDQLKALLNIQAQQVNTNGQLSKQLVNAPHEYQWLLPYLGAIGLILTTGMVLLLLT